ncbi:MAG: hypothetical protein NZM09_05580 [Ignavibacterium sp.]|nr:hypothetical protein [Ignavibacterium sp.]MDW8375148.1 hypothetical protein [Ignavibacteriales bacterium]
MKNNVGLALLLKYLIYDTQKLKLLTKGKNFIKGIIHISISNLS